MLVPKLTPAELLVLEPIIKTRSTIFQMSSYFYLSRWKGYVYKSLRGRMKRKVSWAQQFVYIELGAGRPSLGEGLTSHTHTYTRFVSPRCHTLPGTQCLSHCRYISVSWDEPKNGLRTSNETRRHWFVRRPITALVPSRDHVADVYIGRAAWSDRH